VAADAKGEATMAGIINAYLADADRRYETGDLSSVSFRVYCWIGRKRVANFGFIEVF